MRRIYRSAEEFIGGRPKGALTVVTVRRRLCRSNRDLRILKTPSGRLPLHPTPCCAHLKRNNRETPYENRLSDGPDRGREPLTRTAAFVSQRRRSPAGIRLFLLTTPDHLAYQEGASRRGAMT